MLHRTPGKVYAAKTSTGGVNSVRYLAHSRNGAKGNGVEETLPEHVLSASVPRPSPGRFS
jgi:hypothetical protein